MNWLGSLIVQHVLPTDDVLDLGCGIMQATGRLGRSHVGVDCYQPYLDQIGPPNLCARLPEAILSFKSKSFDVVLLLDIVEHLEEKAAITLIQGSEKVARRKIIIFTPDGFSRQDDLDAWGLGVNPNQKHLCGFTAYGLSRMDYECERYANGKVISVLGVKCV